jgi:hypothetical protein
MLGVQQFVLEVQVHAKVQRRLLAQQMKTGRMLVQRMQVYRLLAQQMKTGRMLVQRMK